MFRASVDKFSDKLAVYTKANLRTNSKMAGEDKSGMMVNIMKGSLETIKEMDSVDLYIRTEKSKKDNGSKTNLRDSEKLRLMIIKNI